MLFVSYARQDSAAIGKLLTGLRRAHREVWWDDQLSGGEAWWRTILEHIRSTEVFVTAVSNNWLASKPCQAELAYAQALQRPILPVQIGPVDSLRLTPLAGTQILDYRNPTRQAHVRLTTAVQRRQGQLAPLPRPLPVEPPVPFAYLMRATSILARPELTRRQQAELVWELKDRLDDDRDDPTACRDITQLLCRLHGRPDVTWRTRTDIETVLGSIGVNLGNCNAEATTSPLSGRQLTVTPPSSGPNRIGMRQATSDPQTEVSTGPNVESTDEASVKGRKFGTTWLTAGAILAVVVAVVLAVVLTHRSRPEPLDSMLLSEDDINAIMGASNMEKVQWSTEDEQYKRSDEVYVSPPDCLGLLYPGMDRTYQGKADHLSWQVYEKRDPHQQALYRAGDGNHYFVDEDVAAFPPGDGRALAFVKDLANQWRVCAGQKASVYYTNDDPNDRPTYTWNVGVLTGDAPKLTQSYTQDGGHGYACQRVLSALSRVVIDVKACGDHITDEANRIAEKIAGSMTHTPKF